MERNGHHKTTPRKSDKGNSKIWQQQTETIYEQNSRNVLLKEQIKCIKFIIYNFLKWSNYK